MTAVPPRRKGWCPGALRPMETGDGLLARVRTSGGRLTLDQAETIADAALHCGNGAISLSARGNLQIRGVRESVLQDLQARLDAAGLIDSNPEIERLRNIVVSPLSDIDPEAAFDLAPSVAALEACLAEDASLRPLPAKFSFVIDAGGRLAVGDIDADLRFEAARELGAATFAVYLAGDDALAAICGLPDLSDAASRLARAFLDASGKAGTRRMRMAVEHAGAAAIFARAGLMTRVRPRSKRSASLGQALGAHVFDGRIVVGAAAPFGDIDAERFKALILRAKSLGGDSLRLAPWRVFLITGLRPRQAASLVVDIARLGFILNSDDLRLRVAACPGAPACMHAARSLREDAARWAALLPKGEGVLVHVSGCAKGCARPFATAVTAVATETGYDLVVGGKPGDKPGRRGLAPSAVDALLADGGLLQRTRVQP